MRKHLKIRYRIALLTGGTVLVMILIIMTVFYYSITHRMAEQADIALKNAGSDPFVYTDVQTAGNDADTGYSLYSPELIYILDEEDENHFTPKEEAVIRWCSGKQKDETIKTEIDGSIYYIRSTDTTGQYIYFNESDTEISAEVPFSSEDDNVQIYSYITVDGSDPAGMQIDGDARMCSVREMIAYVDVTGEMDMINHMIIIFILTAAVIGTFGTAAGFILGKKLEQNQIAQKQFFENTSHELKTPLTALRGYADGISQGVITDYKKTGRVIAGQTEKMSRLIEEILCMSKLESGSVKLEKEPVEMQEFIQDCLMPFEGTVINKGLNVTLDLEPMTVSADPDKLEHALSNLITNSLKYAKNGIHISCGKGEIRIGNDCEVLTDDVIKHMFERFYTGPDGNTGLGLSIARDYIHLHGWNITAERTGNGICFVIRTAK